VLEHVRNPKKAVKELGRVLKKGGVLLTTVPNSYRRFDGHDVYHRIYRFQHFSRTFYPKELEDLFVENGCKVINRFGTTILYFYPSYLPRYLFEILRPGTAGSSSSSEDEKRGEDRLKTQRKLYKSIFLPVYLIDKGWDLIQERINQYANRNELFPHNWYITYGVVVRKL